MYHYCATYNSYEHMTARFYSTCIHYIEKKHAIIAIKWLLLKLSTNNRRIIYFDILLYHTNKKLLKSVKI